MSGCYVYHQWAADEHLWETPKDTGRRTPRRPWAHGKGPLCLRCGLPRGTWEWEEANDAHRTETGHNLGTYACENTGCDERTVIDAWRVAVSNQPRA